MTENTAFLEQPCRACGTTAWERVQRNGFLEKTVLPLFRLYPWRCPICNKHRYFSLRSDPRIRHAKNSGEFASVLQKRANAQQEQNTFGANRG